MSEIDKATYWRWIKLNDRPEKELGAKELESLLEQNRKLFSTGTNDQFDGGLQELLRCEHFTTIDEVDKD